MAVEEVVSVRALDSGADAVDQVEVGRALVDDVAVAVDGGLSGIALVSFALIADNSEVGGAAGSGALSVDECVAGAAKDVDALTALGEGSACGAAGSGASLGGGQLEVGRAACSLAVSANSGVEFGALGNTHSVLEAGSGGAVGNARLTAQGEAGGAAGSLAGGAGDGEGGRACASDAFVVSDSEAGRAIELEALAGKEDGAERA
jgi:hypothetical protein